jgi:RNA polymerase sigma-70 factor (ECF subfamily)
MVENFKVLASEEAGQEANESEEIRLVKAARREPRAFGKLYLRYVEQVYRYLYARVGNVHDAEDLTAQTFLKAFESLHQLRQEGHFSSWLFTIARNKAMDHYRSGKHIDPIDAVADIGVDHDPLSAVIESERSAALARLVRALPEDEQELLRLRFLAAMSFKEIARIVHRSEAAAKKSVYRLLARLHSQLEVSDE